MVKETVSIDDVCNLLNEFLLLDYECLYSLISQRVKCNDLIANHETIQVRQNTNDLYPTVGLLGVLNGLFGVNDVGMGAICMEIDSDEKIIKFKPTLVKEQES